MMITVLIGGLLPHSYGQNHVWLVAGDTLTTKQGDSVMIAAQVGDFVTKSIMEGYLFAALDSISRCGNASCWYIYLGKNYRQRIRLVPDSSSISDSIVTRQTLYGLLAEQQNLGYPFADLSSKQLAVTGHKAGLEAQLWPGPFIQWDTLRGEISGIKPWFLWKALDIWPGEPFQEEVYLSISRRIRSVPFLELSEDPVIGFSGGRASVYLELQEKRSNTFEGVVGILPDQGMEGMPLATGYLDLEMNNLMQAGKTLRLNWSRYNLSSQTIDIFVRNPYAFKSAITWESGISIVKQDSSFFLRTLRAGIATRVFMNSFLTLHYTNVLSQRTGESGDAMVMPYQTDWYGIKLSNRLGTQPITRERGLWYEGSFSLGNKQSLAGSARQNFLSQTGLINLHNQFLAGRYGAIMLRVRAAYITNQNLYS
ncbi:MAG: hypothetical protein OEY56_02930, partial [Cyclobacteriaceae bacterium]|nr:hypothetical protein [Cyclobacteriaceae bacterium]